MKKFLALIIISTGILQAMEEEPTQELASALYYYENTNKEDDNSLADYPANEEFNFTREPINLDSKESPELSKQTRFESSLAEAIKQSIETEEQRQLYRVIENSTIGTWQLLPKEVKLHIFSYIPTAIKHIRLIDQESYALTEDHNFIKVLAFKLVKDNLKKAVEVFGFAIEREDKVLTKALLKAGILQKITGNENLEGTSIELQAPLLIKSYTNTANKIFVKAAQKNNLALVQVFINAGIAIDTACNQARNNALMEAASHGNEQVVQLLLDHHANVNAKNQYGCSPLYFAICNGQTNIIERLLSHEKIDLEIQNVSGTTPLIIAAKFGYYVIAEFLINLGANVDAEEFTGHTALMYASQNGHLETVNLLLTHKADAHRKTYKSLWSKCALTKQNQNPDACYGYTALMYACEQGHQIIAEQLISCSDINTTNANGLTAFECVVKEYRKDSNTHVDSFQKIMDLLIRNGARIPESKSSCLIS